MIVLAHPWLTVLFKASAASVTISTSLIPLASQVLTTVHALFKVLEQRPRADEVQAQEGQQQRHLQGHGRGTGRETSRGASKGAEGAPAGRRARRGSGSRAWRWGWQGHRRRHQPGHSKGTGGCGAAGHGGEQHGSGSGTVRGAALAPGPAR